MYVEKRRAKSECACVWVCVSERLQYLHLFGVCVFACTRKRQIEISKRK